MHPLITQIVGLSAVGTFLLSYQQKKRRNIIFCNVLSRCLYIVQYLLLGAISGAILDILGAVASVIAEKKDSSFIKKHFRGVFSQPMQLSSPWAL
ncbi:MAG: YgjV family protein [Clostridia bacterium]|nr:YgjV family protein [Clostridia bacterium]